MPKDETTRDPAREFRDWVLDPPRTSDELLPVVYFVYWGRVVWGGKYKNDKITDWDAIREEQKRRRLNPARRPVIDPEELAATVEVFAEVKRLDDRHGTDRPFRSLAVLRLLPQVEEINLHDVELSDLTPLAGLRQLKVLTLQEPALVGGYLLANFAPLAGLPIEKLSLSLRQPWLDFGVLASLPKLREVSLRANLIALDTLPALPAAEIVTLDCDFHWKTPIRSFRHLPTMPRVQRLKVESIASLDGIERLTEARNLDLGGPFADLTPLAALPKVTFLRLQSEIFTDLAPLAQMPALRELLIVREVPFDLSPLTNSASLRQVRVERCDIVATELATINAALNPDQNDFLAETPRPLGPLRFINYFPQDPEVVRFYQEFPRKPEDDPRQSAYGADAALAAAEVRWGGEQIRARLRRLLGPGWGSANTFSAGHCHVTLVRYRDAIRIHEVLRELREFSASSRYPWQYMLIIEPHRDLGETMEEIRAREEEEAKPRPGHWLEREFDAEEERQLHEEFREGRREEYERLAAEHRLRLQQEQELPIDPAAFDPVSVPPPKPGGPAPTAVEEEDAGLDEDDDESDLMEGSPGEAIADDAMEELECIVTLTEDFLWSTEHMRENAEYMYGEPAEDWHSLPQPIEQRPRPG